MPPKRKSASSGKKGSKKSEVVENQDQQIDEPAAKKSKVEQEKTDDSTLNTSDDSKVSSIDSTAVDSSKETTLPADNAASTATSATDQDDKMFKGIPKDEAKLDQNHSNDVVLEKGHIYFLYRPRVDITHAESLEQVQRFYMILRPSDDKSQAYHRNRLIAIPKKTLPLFNRSASSDASSNDTALNQNQRFFAFVEKSSANIEDLQSGLDTLDYSTASGAEKHQENVRIVGKGAYEINFHRSHTALSYVLETPSSIGSAQQMFNVGSTGSFIMIVKNPTKDDFLDRVGRNPNKMRANFDKDLQDQFQNNKWAPVKPSSFLNYEGCELVLIASEIERELSHEEIDQMTQETEEERSEAEQISKELGMKNMPKSVTEPMTEKQQVV